MPKFSISNVGSIGDMKNLVDHTLPACAWLSSHNMRFDDRKAVNFLEHNTVLNIHQVPTYLSISL